MPMINPSSLRAAPNDPMPWHATAEPASHPARDAAGFASLLQQQHRAMPGALPPPPQPPQPPAAAPVAAASVSAPAPVPKSDATTHHDDTGESSDESSAASASSDAGSRQRALLRSHPRGVVEVARRGVPPGDEATPTDPLLPRAEIATAGSEAVAAQNDAATSPPSVDPGVLQWLAAQQRSAAGAPRAPQIESGHDGRAAEPGAATTATTATAVNAPTAALDPNDPAGRAHAAALVSADTGTPPTAVFAAVLAEQRGAGSGAAEPGTRAPVHGIDGSGPGVFVPTPDTLIATPAPTAVEIAAPLAGPQFAQELGLRLSVLAADGVQRAELHLNPAEMGPVSVQIVMDGTQARIDFGADLAATRQAIEAGLPSLAGALADAGFTLAGGGVSQHAAGQPGSHASDGGREGREPRREAASEEAVARVASTARRIVTAGGVDVFA